MNFLTYICVLSLVLCANSFTMTLGETNIKEIIDVVDWIDMNMVDVSYNVALLPVYTLINEDCTISCVYRHCSF